MAHKAWEANEMFNAVKLNESQYLQSPPLS